MVFSSFQFILCFMPLFFLSYYIADVKTKNFFLFLFSLGFYAYGCFDHPHYFLILVFSLIINYHFGIAIASGKINKKLILVIALFIDFGILFVFKYFDFFIDVLTHIRENSSINKLNLVLPIGISFYTFQIVSYVVDVYFGKIEVEKKFINFATYVIMFPQLIAGPIVRYSDIMKEIKADRTFNKEYFFKGLSIFIIGLSSKVIVANQLSLVQVDIGNYNYYELSRLGAWGGAIAYSMQMYFDFYGYSLMAIGLGKMMGFTIVENFKDPFLSRSVEEYWRRWHISLSTWFRDYLLYPILMSKFIKRIRSAIHSISNIKLSNFVVNVLATFVVWFATGLWHGANYNFVLWGLYFFIFLNIEQLFLSKLLNKSKVLSHIYLCFVIIISFVIFKNENMEQMIVYFKQMFGANVEIVNRSFYQTIANNYKQMILGVLCVLRVPNAIYGKIKRNIFLVTIVMIGLLSICIFLIYLGYNDPFLYFRF